MTEVIVSSKPRLVELLNSYCNHEDETAKLTRLLEKVRNSKRPKRAKKTPPKAAPERLSPATVAELVARYEAGQSITGIASELKIHRFTVSRYLDQAGVPKRSRSMSQDQIDEAAHLYNQGLSLERVGERVGFTAWTILRALRESGVPIRDSHGRER